MKKFVFISLILMAMSLLGANFFDDNLKPIYEGGHFEEINGDTYWIFEELYFDKDEALDDIAYLATLAVFYNMEWDSPTDPDYIDFLDSLDLIACRWFDANDSATYIVSGSVFTYLWFMIDDEEFYYMDFADIREDISEFIDYLGGQFKLEE
ncbi:MAG: hypothetical protein GX122_01265 [Candidatus Cloacimonetes bacterium]|nr:hypothetical protein [Candidatus Cloacimonadota bacterium]NLO11037.1 hypothetical protein [Candidatus Cloacimonadota bacterium]